MNKGKKAWNENRLKYRIRTDHVKVIVKRMYEQNTQLVKNIIKNKTLFDEIKGSIYPKHVSANDKGSNVSFLGKDLGRKGLCNKAHSADHLQCQL